MKPENCRRRGTLDVIGGCVSLLCALHCLLLPALLPFGVLIAHNFWLEIAFIGTALVVGAWALSHGYKVHGFRAPAVLFLVGIATIVIGNWVLTGGTPLAASHDHAADSVVLVGLGALGIVAAHTLNFILERRSRSMRDAEIRVDRQVV